MERRTFLLGALVLPEIILASCRKVGENRPTTVDAQILESRIPGSMVVGIYDTNNVFRVVDRASSIFERVIEYDYQGKEASFLLKFSPNQIPKQRRGSGSVFLVNNDPNFSRFDSLEELIRKFSSPFDENVLEGEFAGNSGSSARFVFRNIHPDGEYTLYFRKQLLGDTDSGLIKDMDYKFIVPKYD